jgi:uncharacterized protein YukJ
MSLRSYGVLKGKAVARRREGASGTPHYQIQMRDSAGVDYRIAVNVKSSVAPSDLLYLLEDDFRHPITQTLEGLGSGWNALASTPGGASLDYIRANLFDPARLRTLPPDAAGPDNDLADVLDDHVTRAIGDVEAEAYAFGQRWGPEATTKDKVFGFLPGDGVHDIHMNQGNDSGHAGDDGVWQDGGLLLHFPSVSRWIAIFLAFQSQSWHTDDTTGHTLPGTPTRPTDPADTGAMRIVAAMANPAGGAPERETALLLNASPAPVDLSGYKLADRMKNTSPVVSDGPLAPGATLEVPIAPPATLGNSGGAITLLDAAGLKVAGVTYTADQARREGWTIVF